MEWYCELNMLLARTVSEEACAPRYRNAWRLFHHTRRLLVKKQPWVGYVLTLPDGKTRRLEGLTKPLKSVFYPYQQIASTGGAKTGGSARGNAVDRELAALVNHGTIPGEGFSKYTLQVMKYLKKHGLRPFAAQFLVYDENIGIATELDLLCVDEAVSVADANNVVNVQVKTGFDLNYEVEREHLSSPYVKDSMLKKIYMNHKNVHQLQTLAEHMIVQLNYDKLLRESVVLVFSEDVSSLYRIGHELMALKLDVYQNLYKRQQSSDADIQIAGIRAGAAAKKAHAMFT